MINYRYALYVHDAHTDRVLLHEDDVPPRALLPLLKFWRPVPVAIAILLVNAGV